MASASEVTGPRGDAAAFSRVVAVVVGIETYRDLGRDHLPDVSFARDDAQAFADTLREVYGHTLDLELLIDGNAPLTGLKDSLCYRIQTLSDDDLFVFYYAGHGFHGEGGNRLSAWDTNPRNIRDTALLLRDGILDPLAARKHPRSLVFVDACAAGFKDLSDARDVISDLDIEEVRDFLDSGWYCGVFLSCSPGEKSYPSNKLGHGVWTAFLLRALRGEAKEALTRGRWLTDTGLRDWLKSEVPRYITRQLSVRGSQTPQAILKSSNSFRIRHIPERKAAAKTELSVLPLKNHEEYLEGVETGPIRQLDGFDRRIHKVPSRVAEAAERWVRRLLEDRVTQELQRLYNTSKEALALKARDMRLESDDGQGDLDTAVFRYSIETGQNPEDCTEYMILRRLALRSGWTDHRSAISSIFSKQFRLMVIGFETGVLDYADVVDKLENMRAANGGSVEENIRAERVPTPRRMVPNLLLILVGVGSKCLLVIAVALRSSTRPETISCS